MRRSSIGSRAESIIVERASDTLPQSTNTAYFTVTGRVLITQIVGEVTVIIAGAANNAKLIATPTVGAPADMCAAVAITGDAVGTMYVITGTMADAMIAATSGAAQAQHGALLVADGTIDLDCTANNTGETKWTVHYTPLDPGSYVSAA
jgi:hypothetical protein